MRIATIALLLALSACQPPSADQAAIEETPEVSLLEEVHSEPAAKSAQEPKPALESIASEEPMEALEAPQWLDAQEWEAITKPGLCWHGYCPCDSPVNALDRTICRNARAGVEMSDDQWSIGAMARDLKRDGDESNRQMDEVMRDTREQRQELWASQRSNAAPTPEPVPASTDQAPGESAD